MLLWVRLLSSVLGGFWAVVRWGDKTVRENGKVHFTISLPLGKSAAVVRAAIDAHTDARAAALPEFWPQPSLWVPTLRLRRSSSRDSPPAR